MSTLPSTFSRAQYLLRSQVIYQCNRLPNAAFINHCYMSTAASGNGNDRGSYADPSTNKRKNTLPGIQRIILIRHGESLGNIDERAYVTTADWRIPLTERGREQARSAGKKVASHLAFTDGQAGEPINDSKGKIFFYVSPYLRTRQTLREILREVDPECIVGIREDPRM